MKETILSTFFFLVIFLPIKTLSQTTESSNLSQPSTDIRTVDFDLTTTSNTVRLPPGSTNDNHVFRETRSTTPLTIETLVFSKAGLRVWHIAGLVVSGLLIIIIIVCCRVDIRIPRSNQEIDDYDRKRSENKKYIKELDSAVDGVYGQTVARGL